ncbi:MAG TPA: PDZ domain-containing protein [Thermoanaerobaculia bacterium]|nr:PDZ domain-containing protein [Thermoanaerobaculia bacterium]
MRKILVVLLVAGAAAFLLTPLVVSASGSETISEETGAENAAPAPPSPVVIQLGEDGEASDPGYLGVEVVELSEQLRLRFSVPEGRGVLISEVGVGSAAERAGIEAGDVLVSLGSEPVASGRELRRTIAEAGAGNEVPLVVIRDGALVELSAVLARRPARRASREPEHRLGLSDRWDDEDFSRHFEDLGSRIEQALAGADWERMGERWERSGEDWERLGERWEQLGERLGERFERLGERMEHRFEDLGERFEDRAERWEHDRELSAEDWERFGEEMERFGEEWARFGEELGVQFESIDWEAFSNDVGAAVREAVESVDWDQLGESIRQAVEGHRE